MDKPLRDRLQADLAPAMRARDRARVAALRSTLGAIANAEAVDNSHSVEGSDTYASEVARKVLSTRDVQAIVESERDRIASLADEIDQIGQDDEATNLRTQVRALDAHLGGAHPPGS